MVAVECYALTCMKFKLRISCVLKRDDWQLHCCDIGGSWWCCWRLESSGVWCYVIGWVVFDISKEYCAFIFRVKQSWRIMRQKIGLSKREGKWVTQYMGVGVVGYVHCERAEAPPTITPCWLTTLSGHRASLTNHAYLPPVPLFLDYLSLKMKGLWTLETTGTTAQRHSVISQKPGVLGGIVH